MRMKTIRIGCAFIALICLVISSDASAKRNRGFAFFTFGASDDLDCVQDTPIRIEGQNWCVAEYTETYYFLAGVWTSGRIVLGAPSANTYMDMPKGDSLKNFQASGMLPDPLPKYAGTLLDYLVGFSLWIFLGVVGLVIFLGRAISSNGDEADEEVVNFRVAVQQGVTQIIVSVVSADGKVENDEKQIAREIHDKFCDSPLTDNDFDEALKSRSESQDHLIEYLDALKDSLNEEGKAMLVDCAIMAAAADGEIQDDEKELIERIAVVLGVENGVDQNVELEPETEAPTPQRAD